jgi:putative glutamine amidotransferase
MINVSLGGTLHTDIYEVFEHAPRMRTVLPKKTVSIVPGSRLDRTLRCNPCRVNALHHQSVDRLGRGLRAVAKDEAGVVQGIEGEGASFLIGVQWHPELLVWKRPQQRLFAALVEAATAAEILLPAAVPAE